MNRIALLVVGIEQEVEREPFDVYLMFQNRVVQENKRDPGFSSSTFFFLLPLFVKNSRRTVSKDANGANMYKISSGRFFADWIHMDRIGP